MQLEINPLTPALAPDFFDFFDNRAFTDRGGAFCYCIWFHCGCSVEEHYGQGREAMRECAADYIRRGLLNGYLAYDGPAAVGWCNADKKERYPRLTHDPFLCTGDGEKTKSVVCFEIAPAYRGRGIAAALLARVCADAQAEGYAFVEGYPASHENPTPYDYAGPVRLYEKAGFVKTAEQNRRLVMRKGL